MKQARHGGLGRAQLGGDFRERPPLQVMQLDRPALGLGKCRQRFGHAEQFLLLHGVLAGRRLLGGEPLFEPRGRLVQCVRRASTLASRPGAWLSASEARRSDCGSRSTAARRWFPSRSSAPMWPLAKSLVSFEQRLLNDTREIDPSRSRGDDLEPGQERQIGAEPLQVAGLERFDDRIRRAVGC